METAMKKLLLVLVMLNALFVAAVAARDVTLLNVSYDPTRELYRDINTAFAAICRTEARANRRVPLSMGFLLMS
jgi:sulfate/thiosulfate transport system substrate-binding protein